MNALIEGRLHSSRASGSSSPAHVAPSYVLTFGPQVRYFFWDKTLFVLVALHSVILSANTLMPERFFLCASSELFRIWSEEAGLVERHKASRIYPQIPG